MRRGTLTACLTIVALGAFASPAAADVFQRIYQDYRSDGHIEACNYTPGELETVAGSIPPDIEQYAPDFAAQLAAARQTLAGGGCAKKAAPKQEEQQAPVPVAPAAPSAPAPKPQVEIPEPPAPKEPVSDVIETAVKAPAVTASGRLSGGAAAPAPVWLLAGLAAIAVLAGLSALLSWFFGWSPERFTRPFAAATADAGGRTADLAGEFWDWLRLGR